MKRLFNVDHSEWKTNWAILLMRIGVAALMLSHGIPKLQTLLSDNIQFPEIFGMSGTMGLALTVLAEVVCSVFILLGLGTRLAVIPLIITMMVAVFHIHIADPFAKQELGIIYIVLYIILYILGSGKYSLDFLLNKNLRTKTDESAPIKSTALGTNYS